jgi:transposase-like protein
MPYSEKFRRKMVQKLTGPNALSATALSKEVDVPQTTLSKWLRNAGVTPRFEYPNNPAKTRSSMPPKRPEDWSPEEKLKAVIDAASLADDQLGAFLRSRGVHETHLQQWRLQMLNGLGGVIVDKKPKRSPADTKRIRSLEKDLKRKEKALAETAALLVLKKKALEIWGDEDDSTTPRNGK